MSSLVCYTVEEHTQRPIACHRLYLLRARSSSNPACLFARALTIVGSLNLLRNCFFRFFCCYCLFPFFLEAASTASRIYASGRPHRGPLPVFHLFITTVRQRLLCTGCRTPTQVLASHDHSMCVFVFSFFRCFITYIRKG